MAGSIQSIKRPRDLLPLLYLFVCFPLWSLYFAFGNHRRHIMGQQIHYALTESAHRALVTLASFLPGLIAFLLALFVLTPLGAGLAALLRRILTGMRFDERLSRSHAITGLANIQEWSPSHSPTVLLARVVF